MSTPSPIILGKSVPVHSITSLDTCYDELVDIVSGLKPGDEVEIRLPYVEGMQPDVNKIVGYLGSRGHYGRLHIADLHANPPVVSYKRLEDRD